MKLAPSLAPARLQLGVTLQEMGDYEGAIAELRTAVRLAPDQADARNSLGLALMQKGEAEEAVAALRALVAEHPRTPRPATTWAARSCRRAISTARSPSIASRCRGERGRPRTITTWAWP